MKSTALLRRRILDRRATVAIVGQGYVGLSLACAAADVGFRVAGVDVDAARIQGLQGGVLCVPGVAENLFRAGVATGLIEFTTSPEPIRDAEIVLICVPTPVRDETPDLTFVMEACRHTGERLAPGRLVILESTTYPGTTDEIARPILESSGLMAGRDFLLAYSPERIDPGNVEWGLRTTPKVVGGQTAEATGLATLFYTQFVEKVVPMSSCRAAELAKLLENAFRHVNIALVNELATLCHELEIDVWEVIDAAASKPFGFMPFSPGPGVGGHCIPLDSAYLAWHVRREAGRQFRILEQAQDVNAQMPAYVATRIGEALNDRGKALKGASVFVLGVSYKADVGDVRESPALKVMAQLRRRGAIVSYHDPHVGEVAFNGTRLTRTELTNVAVSRADCVVVLTPHSSYDLSWVGDHAALVFDARNSFGDDRRQNVIRL